MHMYLQTVRNFNHATFLYLLATALLGFSIDGGVYAVIFNLYLLRLGFGPAAIGQINFAGLLTFALFSLPAGALGARFGSRNLMVAGALLLALGSWLLPLAEIAGSDRLATGLMASYVLLFLGLALYFANAAPYLMQVTTQTERGHAFSMQTAMLALAAFLGSVVGGYLPRIYATWTSTSQDVSEPYRFPLFVAALFMTFSAWTVLRLPTIQDSDDDQITDSGMMKHRGAWLQATLPIVVLIVVLSLIRLLQVAGIGTVATYFNVYLDAGLNESTARIGVLAASARIAAVPAALLTPFVIAKWGAPRAVVLSSAASSLFILPLAIFPTWQAAGIGYIGVIAFSSLRYPAFIAYSLDLVPRRWRGTLSGAGETAGGFSFAAMALVGGYLIGGQGYEALFWVSAFLTLLGTILFWFYFRSELSPATTHSNAQIAP